MNDDIHAPVPSATCTQPVRINLRSYVMRLLEKERRHPGGLVMAHRSDDETLAWRKQKFSPMSGA